VYIFNNNTLSHSKHNIASIFIRSYVHKKKFYFIIIFLFYCINKFKKCTQLNITQKMLISLIQLFDEWLNICITHIQLDL